jgi:hypothetical protein
MINHAVAIAETLADDKMDGVASHATAISTDAAALGKPGGKIVSGAMAPAEIEEHRGGARRVRADERGARRLSRRRRNRNPARASASRSARWSAKPWAAEGRRHPESVLRRVDAAPAAASDREHPFTKHTLDNGLDVLLHEDHACPIAAVNLWYHVGSKNERPARRVRAPVRASDVRRDPSTTIAASSSRCRARARR